MIPGAFLGRVRRSAVRGIKLVIKLVNLALEIVIRGKIFHNNFQTFCSQVFPKTGRFQLSHPIFDFISFKNVHIDPLHEHIRIPSHLLNLTYRKLISFDNSKSFDLNKLRP